MKLKNSTLILVLIATILGSGIYLWEFKTRQEKITQQQQDKVVTIDSNQIQKISISQPNLSLELLKTNDGWQMIKPQKFLVNEGVMAFFWDLIEKDKSDRKFKVTPQQLAEYGLKSPIATITLSLNNGEQQQLLLGKETINPNLIYARRITNSQKDNAEVITISKNWQYAIERELTEWQSN